MGQDLEAGGLAGSAPDRSELIEFTEAAPNAAGAMVKLYRGYRESLERLSGLSSMMAKEGSSAVLDGARLPVDELRQALREACFSLRPWAYFLVGTGIASAKKGS